jgi:hypothetical protein
LPIAGLTFETFSPHNKRNQGVDHRIQGAVDLDLLDPILDYFRALFSQLIPLDPDSPLNIIYLVANYTLLLWAAVRSFLSGFIN